ncbi:MAG: AAA family ATPase [Deltaproteobacteria bacterium]|nr:AAA family ATPase [Deltaproteobacteria bacterium]
MYEAFYGLREKPFNLTPNPAYIFWSSGHEHAYTHLEYAITENKGFGVITGEVGSGKTTLINYLLHKIPRELHVGLINQTDVDPEQFIRMICHEFDLEISDRSKSGMLQVFQDFLLRTYATGKRAVLIVDEAQNLPDRTIEELRMLSNLESEREHLIQIILVGQPELKEKLRRRNLRQFTQRVTVHAHLGNLEADDVKRYVCHRLRVAGAKEPEKIFTGEALSALHRHSRGVPRLINILCDTALVFGFADERRVIGPEVIEEVMASRQDGGILFDEEPAGGTQTAKATTAAAAPKTTATTANPEKLRQLEQQVQLLGQSLLNLEVQVNELGRRQAARDEVVLELLKMLHQNLESRAKTINTHFTLQNKLYQLERELEQRRQAAAGGRKSLFSRWRQE